MTPKIKIILSLLLFHISIGHAQTDIRQTLKDKVIEPYINSLNALLLDDDCLSNVACRAYNRWINLFESTKIKVEDDFSLEGKPFGTQMLIRAYIINLKETWDSEFEPSYAEIFNDGLYYYKDGSNSFLVFSKNLRNAPGGPPTEIVKWVRMSLNQDFKISGIDVIEYPADDDKDGDYVLDTWDDCPGEKGNWCTNGCGDRDNDCIANYLDDCPDKAGNKICNGCPDTDGDGVCDSDEFNGVAANGRVLDCSTIKSNGVNCSGCPDTDGDGICDQNDLCPTQKGLNECSGCPDTDDDGVCDQDEFNGRDANGNSINCITRKANGADCSGCPDSDGDGLCDQDDKCPNIRGSLNCEGCPDTDGDGVCDSEEFNDVDINGDPLDCTNKFAKPCSDCPDCRGCPDSDEDGLCDQIDRCPCEPGSKNNSGCPSPLPNARFSINPFISSSIALGDFRNRAYGSSSPGPIRGGLNMDYTFNKNFGIGVIANLWDVPFDIEQFNTDLEDKLSSNIPSFANVFSTSSGYSGLILAGKLSVGSYSGPVGIRLEPFFGFSYNTLFTNDLLTRVNLRNQDDIIWQSSLLSENSPVYGLNIQASKSWKKIGLALQLQYTRGAFTAEPETFVINNYPSFVDFQNINFEIMTVALTFHYHLVPAKVKSLCND